MSAAPDAPPVAPDRVVELARGRDVPCPVCTYSLRDTVAPKCTECGTDLRIEMFERPWEMPRSTFVVLCYVGLTVWMAGTALALMFGLPMLAAPTIAWGLEVFVPLAILGLFVGEVWLMVRWVRRPARVQQMSPSLRPWAWLVIVVPGVVACLGVVALGVYAYVTL